MKSKHTPAPWHVGELCNGLIEIKHSENKAGAISSPLAKVVARQTWLAEAEANARLIAAAPDLLEALQVLFHAIDSNEPFTTQEREQACVAIDKATGARIIAKVINVGRAQP